ncbi:anti-sigma factor [Lacisediminihabitans changchengi]|uniref:Anti-sigma factor n=1 Tax=Lacisediminihabitans changchengi TaxID=2787634 RepID=A0A934STC4_9MICO|nr:anti-sigma factor [Lacisediminihabitans changchengi]MBK4348575.1 anti-sigma factor [Lacisediminihabitans changchengi]
MVEHVSPEVIALMALFDPDVSSTDRAHTYACDECRAEFEKLSHVVRLARTTPILDELTAPRPAVWDRISAAVREDPDAEGTYSAGPSAETVVVDAADASGREPDRLEGLRRGEHRVAHRRRSRLGRRRIPLGLASIVASVALIVGIGGGAAIIGARQSPSDTVVAAATLRAFPDWPRARGEAKVETTASGTRQLVVTLTSAPESSGAFREVWIMSASLKKLISLGVLVGDSGRFTMPAEISTGAYPVVDISEEPENGSPAHSGNSIVRGTLS